MQYMGHVRIHLAGVHTTSAERKGVASDANLANGHHILIPGEELTTWQAWVTGLERFHSTSTWRYACIHVTC